jgi:tetratricopeptide (TPR) repeat protein
VTTGGPDGYDVFLCYAWEDKPQADALRAALTVAGLRVFQDDDGMRDYDYIPERIDTALRTSRALLALYTPAFPASEYCRQELHFALLRSYHLHRSRTRALAVVQHLDIEQVRPDRLKWWRLPSLAQPFDRTAASIAAHVRRLGDEDPRRLGDAPDPPTATWYPTAPWGGAEMYGRELDLWRIHDGLFADDDPNEGGQTVALVGPGGQGKTMLAQQYARLFAADFPAGVFLLHGFGSHRPTGGSSARVQQSLNRQLVHIANLVAAAPPSSGAGVMTSEVSPLGSLSVADTIGWLHRHLRELGPYLWIVDDVPTEIDRTVFDALRAPTGNGRTLLTAQHELRGWVHPDRHVALAPLERAASLSLLTSRWPAAVQERAERRLEGLRRDRHQYEAACRTVEALGAHPLALTLAAGLCGAPDATGIADLTALAQLVTDPDRDALALAEQLRPRLPTDHIAGVAATLRRSLTTLPRAGLDVLLLASLLGPQPVPLSLMAMVIVQADELAGEEAARHAAEALDDVQARCLAQPHAEPMDDLTGAAGLAWKVHPLVVRGVRQAGLSPQRRQHLRLAAVTAFARELDDTRDGRRPPLLAGYLAHIEHLAAGMADLDEWHLLNEAGRVHAELGDSRAALDLFHRLHEACRARLGDHDLTTLAVQLGLGVAHLLHGDHATARRLHEATHAALSQRLGPNHPDTLTAWNDLAVACGAGGDHGQARDIYRSVHEIRDRTLGPNHPDTLDALTNYAIAAGRCEDHAEAHRIKSHLYQVFGSIYGQEHARTLDALNNLAVTTLHLHDRAGAREMFRDVHRIRRRLLGPRPPTADAADNLAATVDDAREAADLLVEAYRIRLPTQGPPHPATERTLHRILASLLREEGVNAPGTAAPARTETIEVVEVLPAGMDLGRIRLDDERMDQRIERLQLAIRVYDERLATYGPDDPATMIAVCYLAHAQAVLDQFDDQIEQAWVLIDDATAGLELTLGPDDPSTRAADELRRWISTVGTGQEPVEAENR